MKTTKAKKPSRKSLIRKLDSLVSKIVRERDGKCVQCGSTYQLTAGHIFSRRFYITRWDLENVYVQCWADNFKHGRDQAPYFLWYINKFGLDKFQELDKKAHSISNFKDFDLQEMLVELESAELESIGGE